MNDKLLDEDKQSKNKRLLWKQECLTVFLCCNKQNERLGFLRLESVGRHMHWCWYQFENVSMSPGCLEEVREKQKELFKTK